MNDIAKDPLISTIMPIKPVIRAVLLSDFIPIIIHPQLRRLTNRFVAEIIWINNHGNELSALLEKK